MPRKPDEALPQAHLAEPLKRRVKRPTQQRVSSRDRSSSCSPPCSKDGTSLELLLETLTPRLLEAHRERLAAETDADCIGLQLVNFKRASSSMSALDLSEMDAAIDALAPLVTERQ